MKPVLPEAVQGGGLAAAEDEAGDVVGLTSGTDKIFDGLH